jgi:hypothetical protein
LLEQQGLRLGLFQGYNMFFRYCNSESDHNRHCMTHFDFLQHSVAQLRLCLILQDNYMVDCNYLVYTNFPDNYRYYIHHKYSLERNHMYNHNYRIYESQNYTNGQMID